MGCGLLTRPSCRINAGVNREKSEGVTQNLQRRRPVAVHNLLPQRPDGAVMAPSGAMLIPFVPCLDKSVQPHLIIIESRPLKRLLDSVRAVGRANKGYIRHGIVRGHHLSLDTGSMPQIPPFLR